MQDENSGPVSRDKDCCVHKNQKPRVPLMIKKAVNFLYTCCPYICPGSLRTII